MTDSLFHSPLGVNGLRNPLHRRGLAETKFSQNIMNESDGFRLAFLLPVATTAPSHAAPNAAPEQLAAQQEHGQAFLVQSPLLVPSH